MSLRLKLSFATFCIVAVLVIGIALIVQKGQHDLMESILEDRMHASVNTVQTVLHEKAGQSLAVAMTSANVPAIVEAAREQDRTRAVEQLGTYGAV